MKDETPENNQWRAPLVEGIYAYLLRNPLRFHMPAHKGRGNEWFLRVLGRRVMDVDLSEVRGLDVLGEPAGVIREAEALAAEAFGADHTFFSVNGSSAGLAALMISCCRPGDRVALPRNIHRSAVTGLVLSGAIPVFVEPELDDDLGVVVATTPESYKAAFESVSSLRMALVIHPTYEGFVSDVFQIVRLAHERGIIVVADEAHGGHFRFHESLPPTALEAGVDATVQGLHKTCGSLTQTSMVHIRGGGIHVGRLASALRLLQTTSPSYPLMASLDLARRTLAQEGERRLGEAIELSAEVRNVARSLGMYSPGSDRLPGRGVIAADPTKVLVNGRGIGLPSRLVVEILRDEYAVEPEYHDEWNILFMVTIGDTREAIASLCNGLRAGVQAHKGANDAGTSEDDKGISLATLKIITECKDFYMSPREAYFSDRVAVEPAKAPGRIAAETVCVYPPGVVLLAPGQAIRAPAVDALEYLHESGLRLEGLAGTEPLRIWVVGNE